MTTVSGFVIGSVVTQAEVSSSIIYAREELDLLADVVAFLREHRRRRLAKDIAQLTAQGMAQATVQDIQQARQVCSAINEGEA